MKRRLHFCSVLIAFLGSLSLSASAAQYDVTIRGGKIVDGTGNPWFYGQHSNWVALMPLSSS